MSGISRRRFLATGAGAIATAIGGGLLAGGAAAGPVPSSDDKLILGAPLTHSDWMLKPGLQWGAPGVKHMLDACKACGWSQIYWRAFDGGRAMYPSRIARPGDRWDADSFWSPQSDADRALDAKYIGNVPEARRREILEKCAAMDYAKFDALGQAVRYGHEIGLKIHAWVSINEDDHGWGLVSDFARAHPEFRWRKRDGTSYHSQLSFGFQEVRRYKLSLLDEILTRYEIDGLFLDWIRTGDVRDNPQTDPTGVANSGYETPLIDAFKAKYGIDVHHVPNGDERWIRVRAEPQTVFMRSARELSNKHRNGLPIAVLVANPWQYRGLQDPIDGSLRGLLLDVPAWSREGLIDAAVSAGYYRSGGSAEAAYLALRKEVGPSIDVWLYEWVPQTVQEFEDDARLAYRLGARQILFWEADYIDDRPKAADIETAMSRASRPA